MPPTSSFNVIVSDHSRLIMLSGLQCAVFSSPNFLHESAFSQLSRFAVTDGRAALIIVVMVFSCPTSVVFIGLALFFVVRLIAERIVDVDV